MGPDKSQNITFLCLAFQKAQQSYSHKLQQLVFFKYLAAKGNKPLIETFFVVFLFLLLFFFF